MSAGSLELSQLTRAFAGRKAVDAVSLEVGAGELVALIGASGSGKTTTLRMVAGYETPDSGRVLLDGRDITETPPQKRGFGMVFQHYALFPHMTVQDNVAFGLEARGVARGERRARAQKSLERVGLGWASGRSVQALSGGEQQRVALARALVIEPRVLLLDEPLSNLDPTLRRSMRDELRAMLREARVTALFVTHDQEDAFAVADRVALLRSGRLLQLGRPEELYAQPASRDVASFVGRAVFAPAVLRGDRAELALGGGLLTAGYALPTGASAGDSAWLAVIRPESLCILPDVAPVAGSCTGEVLTVRFAGSTFVHHVKLSDELTVEIAAGRRMADESARVVLGAAQQISLVPA